MLKKFLGKSIPFFIIVIAVCLPFLDVIMAKKTLLPSSNYAAGVFSWGKAWQFCCREGNEFQYYLDYGAPSWMLEPYTHKISNELKRGSFPFWNNNSIGGGLPLAADFTSAGLFLPFRWPTFFFPNQYTLNLYFLLRLIIGAIGMYWFLRLIHIKKIAAFFGAIIFPLTGYFMLYIAMDHLNSDLLIPYGFIAAEYLLRNNKKNFLFGTLLFGYIFLNGNPEVLFLILMFSSIYFLYRLFELKLPLIRKISQYSVSVLVGFLLSAFYFIPSLEFLLNSTHAHNVSDFSGIRTIPLKGIGTILFPYLFGVPTQERLVTTYIGIGLSFLFLVALFTRFRKVWFFALTFILILLKIYYTPIWNEVGKLPFLNLIVLTKYLAPFLGFFLIFAVSIFLNNWVQNKKFCLRFKHLVITIILFLILSSIFLTISELYNDSHIFVKILPKLLKELVLVFAISLILILSKPKFRKLTIIIIALFLYGELVYYQSNIKRSDLFNPYNKPPYVAWLQLQKEPFRIFSPDGMLFPNTFAAYNLDDIRVLLPMMLPGYLKYINNFINPTVVNRFTGFPLDELNEKLPSKIQNNQFFDALNVKYIIESKNPLPFIGKKNTIDLSKDKQFKLVYDMEALIYENKNAFPRIFSVNNTISAKNEEAVINKMKEKKFSIKNTAIVENFPLKKKQYNTKIEINKLNITSNQLSFFSTAEKPAFLVISQNYYYPGWEAKINGDKVPLYKTNQTMVGIEIKSGYNNVIIYYNPKVYLIGGFISIFSLILLILFTIPNINSKTESKKLII